ncbi:hypothetical protein RRF57_003085 [Xylaria bambusicola]|uniref:Major facilitator superfamily (MFS) profile domain-containing protein n=1 Tax=Xylaria bambusicola TaxID=326684 RepID=A0AAN7U869_9PEZI
MVRTDTDTKSVKRVEEEELELYSVFNRAEKFCIVILVSFAIWFSALSNFIYYPALQQLSEDLSVSIGLGWGHIVTAGLHTV